MGLRLYLTLLKNCWKESNKYLFKGDFLYSKLFIINIWVLEFVLHFKFFYIIMWL